MSGGGQQAYSATHDARASEPLAAHEAWNFDDLPGEWPDFDRLPNRLSLDAQRDLYTNHDPPPSSNTFTGSLQLQGRGGEAGVTAQERGRGVATSLAGPAPARTSNPATAPDSNHSNAGRAYDTPPTRLYPNTAPSGGNNTLRRRSAWDDLEFLAASAPFASEASTNTDPHHHHHHHRSSSYGFEDHLFSDIDDLAPSRNEHDPAAFDLGLFSEDDDMPTTTRRGNRRTGGDVVDLTSATSPAPTADEEGRPLRKRRRVVDPTTASSSSSKRPRTTQTTATASARTTQDPDRDIDTLDLTENPNLDSELLLATQQTKTILHQNAPNTDSGPQRLGKHTCPICLGEFTDAAVTVCGHIHCHECLWQAIRAGERTSERKTGNCPVCRKGLSVSGRKKGGGGVVAVSFLTRKGWEAGKGRRGLEEL